MTRILPLVLLLLLTPAGLARAEDEPARHRHGEGDRPAHAESDHRPPPPEADRDRPSPPAGARMSEADMDEAISVIGDIDPETAERMTQMRDDHPDEVSRELRRRFPRFGYLLRLKRHDPEMYELRVTDIRMFRRDHELANELREAQQAGDEQEAEAARDRLVAHVREHFEHRQKIRTAELERLEDRLQELREDIEHRRDNREEYVEQYVGMLLERGVDERRRGDGREQ